MRLYLVRHGQTDWNVNQKAQGHNDTPLNAIGQMQAERVADALCGTNVSNLWCSDLSRCVMTAAPLVARTKIVASYQTELRERNFGEWEGNNYLEVRKLASSLGDEPEFVRPPQGESLEDLWDRLTPVYERVASVNHDLAIFSHGGTTALMLAMFLRGNLMSARSFRFGNASITELVRREDGYYTLARYADVSHLGSMEQDAHGVVG